MDRSDVSPNPQNPQMAYVYRVFCLPTDDPILLAYYAGRLSALRLSALQTAPASFGSTFARESKFTAKQWYAFLRRPLIHYFVAVAYPAATAPEDQTLDTGDWIGCSVFIGATPKAIFEIPASGGPEVGSDEEENKWHMTFLYSSPLHRGKGVAKMIINGAEEYIVKDAQETGRKSIRMRIFLAPTNEQAYKLYSRLEFVDSGKCTYMEAIAANGDAELLPACGGLSSPQKYLSRDGLAMEKVRVV